MKQITRLRCWLVAGAIGAALPTGLLGSRDALAAVGYQRTDLVTDDPTAHPAAQTDPNLLNAWGLAASPTGPFWVADNHAGVSTLYDGLGNPQTLGNPQPLVVTVPPPAGGAGPASPTGTVFNGSSNFVISDGTHSGPARFLFAAEDGTISGWNPNVPPPARSSQAFLGVDNSAGSAIYKGIALNSGTSADRLYAADFHNGKVDVFDGGFHSILPGSFADPNIPAGYAPFNVALISGAMYVAYAQQDADAEDDTAGPGHGFIDVFDTNGQLLKRFASQGVLNSPWGMTLAPADFGPFSNKLLVGNFGDGRVNAFDPATGAYEGTLQDSHGNPIQINGLWGLSFGNGVLNQPTDSLFFTAGPDAETHGLYGSIRVVPEPTAMLLAGLGGVWVLCLRRRRQRIACALCAVLGSALLSPGVTRAASIIIDPDQLGISATSYYATFGQVPSKMVDNSGLSSALATGAAVPASDNLYPTHDTTLVNMYRSGKDTHPDLFFDLSRPFLVNAMHYWNFNGDNTASHPSGGDRETADDGINSVDIAVSTSTAFGPWTTVGTYTLQKAPALATYRGVTLSLGTTVYTRYVRFHINSNFKAIGPDVSDYFGLSELRFIGASAPAFGHVDDFKAVGTAGWGGGTPVSNPGTGGVDGAADGYLLLSDPTEGNFGTKSGTNVYAGDFTAAGITQVSFYLNNVGTPQAFSFHLLITDAGGTTWEHNTGFNPPMGQWQKCVVGLTDASQWTLIQGTASLAQSLHNVARIHFRHDLPPFSKFPPAISGSLGIDDIELGPDCNHNLIPDTQEPDTDHDGVIDACDACPNTIPGSPVDAQGCPPVIPGDFDHDGDVDSADLDHFMACALGPTIPQADPQCSSADFDGDTDVDQVDFGFLQRCFSGANKPGNPACAN